MNILELSKVGKSFGSMEVIKELSLQVAEHSVFGFIGRNGAGKTTTMKMILGFLKPDAGEIYVCGDKVSYGSTKTNRYIGYLPDVPEFYGYMKPMEYLSLCGEITGLKRDQIKARSLELLELVGLDGVNRRIKGFSRGMKQRLGIAQALINEPKLLICDEPTSALDPVGRKEILDILSLARRRTTIIFSTHILSDVERICDSIGMLDKGRLAVEGAVGKIKDTFRKDSIRLEVGSQVNIEKLAGEIQELAYVVKTSVKEQGIEIELTNAEQLGIKLLGFLVQAGIPVVRYEILEPTLENVFLEAVL